MLRKSKKKNPSKPEEVPFPQAEQPAAVETVQVTQSGLLARYPDGTFREPTEVELLEMGAAMVKRLFPVAAEKPVDDRPKPIISGPHCRICKWFDGDSVKGPLYAAKGECLLFPTPSRVDANDLCNQKRGLSVAFEVNEALRDCNNR